MTILFCLDAPPIVLDFEALIASAAAAIATADPTAICAGGTDGFATGAAATFFALNLRELASRIQRRRIPRRSTPTTRAPRTTPRACDLPAARRRRVVVVVVAHVAFALQLVDAIIVHAARSRGSAAGYGRRRRRDDATTDRERRPTTTTTTRDSGLSVRATHSTPRERHEISRRLRNKT